MATYDAKLRVWRGDIAGGDLQDYTVEVNDGEVVLDIIHRLQATQTPTSPCAGTARPVSAVRARRRSTASPDCCA